MQKYSETENYKLFQGSMLELLEVIELNSIDSIVTDPPYELNFMGKGWDNSGIAFNKETWQKCFEVLKPGGYLLAFGGSRTYHRIACAIEDSGFEIRDCIMWLYGSGFPKSMNIGNKLKQWQGWGTCLKPAYEPIIIARKPFKGILVDNVIEYGVGGLNIDECRVENGRFPSNVILTYDENDFDEVCNGFPNTKSGKPHARGGTNFGVNIEKDNRINDSISGYCDSGSAARYFMNCKYTEKNDEIWKKLFVNNVEENLEIIQATKDNIVQMNVEDLLKELKDHYVKYVENQQDLIEIYIVQDIAKILTWDFKIETSQVIQDFIENYNKCIQFLNLVQFVEKMDNIDTTQTTQNLLKLFGYVKVVITNYIQGNLKVEQNRYLYTPKASKKDRDEGLDEFEEKQNKVTNQYGMLREDGTMREIPLRKNIHTTVKPTELMQYLIRLVTPKNGTILDPFMGSGSTGKAVMYENKERDVNYKFIGIELTDEYLPIAEARINYVYNLKKDDKQLSIYDFEK